MKIDFGNLQEEDRKRIDAFLRTADRLRNSDLFKEGLFALNYSVKGDAEKGTIEERIDRPSEKDVRDALLDFRKFIAESESIFFNTVCNRFYQLVVDPIAREHLASVREGFKNSMAGLNGAATLRIGIQPQGKAEPEYFRPEEVIRLYFNSDYFHTDLDKAPKLDAVRKIGPMSELVFLQTIRNVARCIFYLAALIRREFALPVELQKLNR